MQPYEDNCNKGFRVNLNIHDSTVTASRDTHIYATQNNAPPKDAMEILRKHVAFGALFDSKERFDPPKCHPDTRKAVLEALSRWAQDQDGDAKSIMWLRGAAGAGKSAIAQTSTERWEELKILVASFFFSRTGTGRNESSRLIPTLAYQLSLSIPSAWPHMKAILLRDVGLFERSLKTQMTELIIRPLAAVVSEGDLGCHVVVIDGLDECCIDLPGQEHEAQQRNILDAITFYSQQANCPLRFLIASRPERQIRTSFSNPPLTTLSRTIVLDDKQNPDADIELFLNCSFDEIRRNHPYLDSSWPPDGTIYGLLHKSSGHFIYASTAVRYMKRPRQDPRAALEAILNINATTTGKDSPFAELDALYMLIMHSVSPESLPVVCHIFDLMCLQGPTFNLALQVFSKCDYLSPVSLERYLFLPPGSLVYTHLVDLHSILEIPADATSKEHSVRFIHASFSEFLMNPSRSGSFCVEMDEAVARFLPIRLRHAFIQSLQSDWGDKLGYMADGSSLELLAALGNDTVPPPQAVEGLIALVGEDKELFATYVRSIGLSHFGVKRNHHWVKRNVCLDTVIPGGNTGIGVILSLLKKHGVRNFKTLLEGYEILEGEIIYRPDSNRSQTFGGGSSESANNDEVAIVSNNKDDDEKGGKGVSGPDSDEELASAHRRNQGRASSESVQSVGMVRVRGDSDDEEDKRVSAPDPNLNGRKGLSRKLHRLRQRLSAVIFWR